jgi:hypothetical protein
MTTASLQERKLNIIGQLLIINDDKIFQKVEKILDKSIERPHLNKMSKEELLIRAKKADMEIASGEVLRIN